MLNENLMDSKDIIIAKLKLAIKEFQEYDIERKKYYSNALVELGKLKDEIEELRGINKYSKSYIAMKDENRRLKASLARKGIKELTDFYDVKNVELIIHREIYNDKDELMWHNAELVNRGEIITQGIRSISENLSLIMEGEPESFRGGDIAFSTARRVMEMLGWKCSYAGKATLGQDAYYCIICTKPDKDFKYKIFGNAYEGSISISKEKL